MYVPRGHDEPSSSSSTSSSMSTMAAYRPPKTPTARSSLGTPAVTSLGSGPPRANRPGFPSGPNPRRENAESEVPIEDQSVDPETLQPHPRPSRRQRRAAAAGRGDGQGQLSRAEPGADVRVPPAGLALPDPPVAGGDPVWRDQLLRDLGDLRVRQGAKSEWNSRKGPAQGVRWRGGTPLAPPAWSYHRDDLRAYNRWERKVRVWELQVSAYPPPNGGHGFVCFPERRS